MFFKIIPVLRLTFLILIFLQIWSQKHLCAINEKPYRELQNYNDQGQRNAGTLRKYAHFSSWKTSVYISITDQKNSTIFMEVEINSCI